MVWWWTLITKEKGVCCKIPNNTRLKPPFSPTQKNKKITPPVFPNLPPLTRKISKGKTNCKRPRPDTPPLNTCPTSVTRSTGEGSPLSPTVHPPRLALANFWLSPPFSPPGEIQGPAQIFANMPQKQSVQSISPRGNSGGTGTADSDSYGVPPTYHKSTIPR